jgi:hypothetical protein
MSDLTTLLDEYLQSPQELTTAEAAKWKLPKRQAIDLIETILRRVTWLYQHDEQLTNAHVERLKLLKLLRVLYTRKLPCTEADLRMMLDLTVPLLDAIAPDGPVDHVMEFIKDNDLTPELCKSLHHFQENLVEQGSVSSMQSLRQRLHTLLWMDEWEPLNPTRCWSETIRRDYRAMKGEQRAKWRRLLKHIRGNAPQNMPPSWAKEAEARLAAVGEKEFGDNLAIWFAPFRSGEPLPLSVAGSHILKGLVWYAALTRDESVKEIALWLLDVKWKQKRNSDKSMVALQVLGISKDELSAGKLLTERKSPPSRVLERVLEILKQPMASTNIVAEPDGDLIVVQGQLHFYRIYRSTCRIERVTDNKELELNWPAIPDSFRLTLHRECDSAEQLYLRATMLMYDSINGEYFRVK